MKFTGALTLVLLFVVRASGQCWQVRSFSESVVIPELRSSSVLHVPHVLSLAQCVQACCGLQGCDLAWFFDRRCFVLSCQHKGNCQPKQRPGADSFLVFLQRRPPQTLVLQSIVQGDSYPKPWQPFPRHRGSEDPRKDLDFLEDFQDVDNTNYAESLPSLEEKGGESTDLEPGKEPGLYNWPLIRDEFNQSETFVGQMTTPLSRLESSTLSPLSLSEEKSESSTEKAEPARTVTKLLTINTKVEEEPQNTSTDSLVLKGIPTETLELSTVSVFATSPTALALEEPGVVVSIKAPGNLTMLENTSELIGSVSPDNTSEVMVNKPPKAILLPKSQDVVLQEGLIVTINGSQSVDDSKMTHYLWEKVDGPFWDPDGSVDTPILQLRKLLPGQYTFKLTVSDSEGLTDSSTALVSVRRPKDMPPQARGGTDQVITLPLNRLSLQGNRSTDDNSITSFLWTLLTSSHNQEVTMQNVRSPVLELSDLEEGQYTFQLAVTDDKGQQDFDTVTVTVLPANKPPVAITGPDRELLLPVSSFTLNGSDSTDDQAISTYQWDFLSGPPGVKIKDPNNPVAIVTGLSTGNYKFKLTVTDQQGQTDSAVLSVAVKEAQNLPLVAHASGSHTLTLPNNSLVLRGSVSNGETSNVSFLWVRDEQSPAAGDVLYSSDHEALLYLANLVEGTYLFQLRVTDAQGRSSMATATVEVRPDPREQEEVDVELQVGVSRISRQQKDTVVRQLAALLHVMDSEIALKGLHKQSDISTVFRLSVLGPDGIIPGPKLARLLRNQLLREKTDFLLFKVLRVDTVACVLLCSGRGQCDPITRTCSCDPLWTENPIHRFFDGENNCDWNVMYVTISCLLTIVFFLSVSWVCVCCCKRGRRSKVRKKTKYTVLDSMDEQERMELRPKYNIKHRSTEHNSSLMMSESEMDSEQDGVFIPARGDKARIRVASALRNGDALNLRHV